MMGIQHEAAIGIQFRRTTEKIMAVTTLIMGVGLLFYDQSFSFGSYAFLAMVGTAVGWAMYLTVLGAVRLTFLIVNGYYPHSPIVRAALSVWTLLTVWSPIATAFLFNVFASAANLGDPPRFYPGAALAPAFIVLEGLSFYALVAMWRVKRDGRRDRQDRSGLGNDGGVDNRSDHSDVAREQGIQEAGDARASTC